MSVVMPRDAERWKDRLGKAPDVQHHALCVQRFQGGLTLSIVREHSIRVVLDHEHNMPVARIKQTKALLNRRAHAQDC